MRYYIMEIKGTIIVLKKRNILSFNSSRQGGHMIQKLPHDSQTELLAAGLKPLESLAVMYSGGVDSTFLLAAASQIIPGNVTAMISTSVIHPERETREAVSFLKKHGFRYLVLDTWEMRIPDFVANPADRCYYCKRHLFEQAIQAAKQLGMQTICHGANVDDLEENRPGFKAAEEFAIKAPLIEANFTKPEIRRLSRAMNLPTWNKPAMACLATRIPPGVYITEKKLKMVDRAESVLLSKGFTTCRVRIHDAAARIELLPDEIHRLFQEPVRTEITLKLKSIGFERISVDIEGYLHHKTQPSVTGG